MRKIILYLIIIFSIRVYSYTYDDYDLFIKGKNAYEMGKYDVAKSHFEQFMHTYKDSRILKNNYAYYYIGATYYRIGNLEKASFYLEKAVFSLKSPLFKRTSFDERSRFYMMRDFLLGEIFLKMGNKEKAVTYLKRLEYNVATDITSSYEKKALELIKGKNDIYDQYYRLKFKDEFEFISKFETKILISVGNYFVSGKEFKKAVKYYGLILKNKKLSTREFISVETSMLRGMLRGRMYDDIIKYGSEREKGDHINFYLGMAYQYSGRLNDAITAYNNVKSGSFHERSKIQIAGILYSIKKYGEVIRICSNLQKENFLAMRMMTYSYLELQDRKNFKLNAQKYIDKYPSMYDSLLFYYYLKDKKREKDSKNTILKMGIVIDNYIKDLQPTLGKSLSDSKKIEIDKIKKVTMFNNEDLVKIEIENSSFANDRMVENGYSITTILEEGGFYNLAYKNSTYYKNQFFKNSDTIKYIYPKYYKEIVEKYAKKYDIPPILIYTIINVVSKFNSENISENGIGLMEVRLDKGSMEILANPESNIDLGCQKLKGILTRNNGNLMKSLIAYVNDEEYLKRLRFDSDNNLDIDSIIDPREKHELQELLITYMMYNKLYFSEI
ncbi:tetratricopeptide repeat protein [Fusobacterium sp. PH5-44]|uniref:tetratricopeptide repeat protein n=1 Tax=unclassified Fusobacterium TaxID=2648384 RepID=UPI003D23A7DA